MMNSKVEKVDSIETKGKVAKSSDKVRIFYQDSLGKI